MADTQAIVDKIRALPQQGLVRTLYETIPWNERPRFEARILDPAIRPLQEGAVLVGPAYTVADPWMAFDMLADEGKHGCVITMASSGCEGTFVGGFMARLAQDDGAVGMLTDGYVTGSESIIHRGLPVFAKGARIPYAGYSQEGRFQVPIVCGGVVVQPGDIIVGDRDGVIVLEPDDAAVLADEAQWIVKVIRIMTAKYLDKGVRFVDVPGVREYWSHKVNGTRNEADFYREWVEEYGGEDP